MEVNRNLQTVALNLYCIAFSNFRYFNSPEIFLKTFLSKAASRLAKSLFKVQVSALFVATGLINNVLWIFIFFRSGY
jgi:hypothetical protein